MRHNRISSSAAVALLTVSLLFAGQRETAVPFSEDEAKEHAEVFCGRAGLVKLSVSPDRSLQLCGSSYGHAFVRLQDMIDLFSRMNSDAVRDGWVFFGPTHGTTVVFKLRRNNAGLYEAPPVAFVPDEEAPPLDSGVDAVRQWLSEQPAVARSGESANEGAIISWGPVAED